MKTIDCWLKGANMLPQAIVCISDKCDAIFFKWHYFFFVWCMLLWILENFLWMILWSDNFPYSTMFSPVVKHTQKHSIFQKEESYVSARTSTHNNAHTLYKNSPWLSLDSSAVAEMCDYLRSPVETAEYVLMQICSNVYLGSAISVPYNQQEVKLVFGFSHPSAPADPLSCNSAVSEGGFCMGLFHCVYIQVLPLSGVCSNKQW